MLQIEHQYRPSNETLCSFNHLQRSSRTIDFVTGFEIKNDYLKPIFAAQLVTITLAENKSVQKQNKTIPLAV